MRIETTTRNLYTFDELDEKTQQKAIDGLYDTNVDHDWWDCTYEDAETIGCTITGFDVGRGQECGLSLVDAEDTANKILIHHGDVCDTHKEARAYLEERATILQTEENHDPDECNHDELLEELDCEFSKTLAECYLDILQKEYEYLTTRESILETIEANEYEFTDEGVLA